MRFPFAKVVVLFALLCLRPALAQTVEISYHGCTDRGGTQVVSVADPAAPVLVSTHFEAGRQYIRYNPQLLPRLQENTRLFLYAHECARHNLGLALDRALTPDEAQRADCWGLESLLRSGLLKDAGALAALQDDLQFTTDEWLRLPGPPRAFDLPACQRSIASRPSLVHPPAGQDDWNTCVRRCGETLRACRTATCNADYERCVATCNGR